MRAIDTNVIVRFLTADDLAQAAVARRAIEAGDIFIPTTVLLETEWVLRSGYSFRVKPSAPPSQVLPACLGSRSKIRWRSRLHSMVWPTEWTSPTRFILPRPKAASPF